MKAKLARVFWFMCGDIVAAVHLVFIAGMITYDPDNQLIPPLHEMSTPDPLTLMLMSYAGYQLGRLVAYRLDRPHPDVQAPLRSAPEPVRGAVLFFTLVTALVVLVIQARNFAAQGSLAEIALAKAEAADRMGPLNRIIFTAFPFLAGVLWYTSAFQVQQRLLAVLVSIVCALGLALTLFKGGVILFFVFLLYLSLITRRGGEPSLRALARRPKVALAVVATVVGMYYLSEGEGLIVSLRYVIARLTLFAWEGFAYVVEAPADPDLAAQLQVFLGKETGPPPDLLLASDMLRIPEPPIGIVVTFPGFMFRNFGEPGVVVGALLLGLAMQRLLTGATRADHPSRVILALSLYFTLVRVFLVGNIFHSLRGEVLTMLAVYAFVRFFEARPTLAGTGAPPAAPSLAPPLTRDP